MGKAILVIHNPAAGQRTAEKVQAVVAALRSRAGEVCVHETIRAGHAEEIVQSARQGAYEVIVLAGGDGTLMEGVNGLQPGSTQKLAIIPAGTANVVAMELGLPSSPDALADVILAGRTQRIETATVNGRRFVFTAGAGFDAQVVASVDSGLKRRVGKAAFVAAAARTLMNYRFQMFDLSVDGKPMRAAGVIALNGKFYGGPFVAAPDGNLGDGKLCVVVLLKPGRRAALGYQAALGLGRLHEAPGVAYFTGVDALDITTPAGAPLQADGDYVGHLPVSIRAGAGAVNVVC